MLLPHNHVLDVGKPKTLCVMLGMADRVAKLGTFSANIAFDWHSELPLSYVNETKASNMVAQETVLCKFYTQAKEHVDD